MSPHDGHCLSPCEAELRLEEVEGVVSVALRVWLGFCLGSPVGDGITCHTVTTPVLELNLSGQSHLR